MIGDFCGSGTGFCAIFGPKPSELEFGYDEEHIQCAHMKLKLVNAICDTAISGCKNFASTIDQGACMWGAEACLALRECGVNISYIAVPRSEYQSNRWHPERRERYFSLLERADYVADCGEMGADEYIICNASRALVLGESTSGRLKRVVENLGVAGIPTRLL